MPSLAYFQHGVLVTGAGGFFGSHLCEALAKISACDLVSADVRDLSALQALAKHWRPEIIVHLASSGTVLVPVNRVPEMLDVAADGLIHLLDVFAPKRVILSSSCSVYGDTGGIPVLPSARLNPVSIYALSKLVSERVLHEWAGLSRGMAIILRLGNLVGRGGRGLLGYLVNHALRYPGGDPVAEMRGAGRMLRDYVPVDHAVRLCEAAIREQWNPGIAHILNVGSGRPRTNGQVASVVQQTLREYGISLNIHYQELPASGEPPVVIFNTRETEELLQIAPPSEADVLDAIRDAVLYSLRETPSVRTVSA